MVQCETFDIQVYTSFENSRVLLILNLFHIVIMLQIKRENEIFLVPWSLSHYYMYVIVVIACKLALKSAILDCVACLLSLKPIVQLDWTGAKLTNFSLHIT